MVHQQLEMRGLREARVLTAMRVVPRHLFVEPAQQGLAYADEPLPIGEDQTISQPYMVARMLEAAAVGPHDRVLEVGTGSGYSAAVTSLLCQHVYSVERHESLARQATERLARLGYSNVSVQHADGTLGWVENALYDVVLVPAAPPTIPLALLDQLVIGGRLVIPVGQPSHQRLVRVTRRDRHEFEQQALEWVRFVPLLPGVTHAHAA
ncbi:MAG: protein-L-isoaspartate(D-aspartate) O-methyltransferase [Archangiaceae bacterium]|nr:protein-L-isoaspartate(D-aspartate) O-methyltransferase [Archangiaceae bacterium]